MSNGILVKDYPLISGNITSTTANVLTQNCKRMGHIVVFNCIIQVTTSLGAEILKLPWKAAGRFDFTAKNINMVVDDGSNSLQVNGTLMAADYYWISGTYATNE